MSVLDEILEGVRADLAARQGHRPLERLKEAARRAASPRDVIAPLKGPDVAVIAEVKRSSPSKGALAAIADPAALARDYEAGGASIISVLTEPRRFGGSLGDLAAVRDAVSVPLLRKDFVVDPWQVHESRVMGADCILLIAAALPDTMLRELTEMAIDIGLDVLVEVHNAAELERALQLPTPLVGVNNRDLKSFDTDITTTLQLLPAIPAERLVITESGIRSREDVRRMRAAGVHGFLIGEAFMLADDPGEKLSELFSE